MLYITYHYTTTICLRQQASIAGRFAYYFV